MQDYKIFIIFTHNTSLIYQIVIMVNHNKNDCIDQGIIGGDYRSIARFLFETEGLGKRQVGEYLGLG